MRKQRARGFTLLELLIALMIVAILATLSVARYLNLRDKGLVAAATYDLDLVRKLLAIYAVDYAAYPASVASYQDLQDQLVGPDGQSYGELPYSNTFAWLSYALDANNEYIVRVQAADHQQTVLFATPDIIDRE